jgi:hypothetical protein
VTNRLECGFDGVSVVIEASAKDDVVDSREILGFQGDSVCDCCDGSEKAALADSKNTKTTIGRSPSTKEVSD